MLVILVMIIIFHINHYTNTNVLRLHKAFANGSSANTKLSKTQLNKVGQSGGFLGRLLRLILKPGLLLIGNVLKPLTESVLIPLQLIAAASATDAAIHKKMFGSGMTKLIISNEEMSDTIKIIKSPEEPGLQLKVKQINKKEYFLECC